MKDAHYQNNKSYYKDKEAKRRAKMKQWWREFKATLACVECGEDHPAALDFHHRDPNEKDFILSKFAQKSIRSVKRELEKCDILCSNCHRKLHWNLAH